MAEILIKIMEMPKNCGCCKISQINHLRDKDILYCPLLGEWMEDNVWIKSKNNQGACPLVELPPHGDLKDVDKVITEIKGWYCEDVYAFIHELEIAPTVIPASEGE